MKHTARSLSLLEKQRKCLLHALVEIATVEPEFQENLAGWMRERAEQAVADAAASTAAIMQAMKNE